MFVSIFSIDIIEKMLSFSCLKFIITTKKLLTKTVQSDKVLSSTLERSPRYGCKIFYGYDEHVHA